MELFLSLFEQRAIYSLFSIFLGLLFVRVLQTNFFSPLRKFPGPFWAPLTNVWRLVYTYRIIHSDRLWLDIHGKYGDVVRLGPNMLSFGSAKAARDIYGAGKNFKKVTGEGMRRKIERLTMVSSTVRVLLNHLPGRERGDHRDCLLNSRPGTAYGIPTCRTICLQFECLT